MNPSDFFVVKCGKYTLMRKIGLRNYSLVSDSSLSAIDSIYRGICEGKYATEQELFQAIYDQFGNHSILPVLRTP